MKGLLKLTALCNTGVLLEYGEDALLVDAISCDFSGFTGLSSEEYEKILLGEGPYSKLCGVFFTHCHPDHFDFPRVKALQAARPSCIFFIPDAKTFSSGCIQSGPFSVYYYETPHMPQNFSEIRHFVLLISAGEEWVYFASDAMIDADLHHQFLGSRTADYVFVNPVYLTSPPMRSFLRSLAPKRVFVYHIPADPAGTNGIYRKAVRSVERYSAQLPPVTLIHGYPTYLI